MQKRILQQFPSFYIFVAFCSLQFVNAAPFECGDLTPADCKVKFGEQYEHDFKILQLATINDLYDIFEPIANTMLTELPEDSTVRAKLQNTVDKLKIHMKYFNEHQDNNTEVAETIKEMMKDLKWDARDNQAIKEIKTLIKEHNLKVLITDRMEKCVVDIVELYTEMYAGLREQDIKEYQEYEWLNETMTSVQKTTKSRVKPKYLIFAAELLASKFNLPYFNAIKKASECRNC